MSDQLAIYVGRVAAYEAERERLLRVLDDIAHPGRVFGEGDYYTGMEAGLASAAELAQDALNGYEEVVQE